MCIGTAMPTKLGVAHRCLVERLDGEIDGARLEPRRGEERQRRGQVQRLVSELVGGEEKDPAHVVRYFALGAT